MPLRPRLSSAMSGVFSHLLVLCLHSRRQPGSCRAHRHPKAVLSIIQGLDGRAEGLRVARTAPKPNTERERSSEKGVRE